MTAEQERKIREAVSRHPENLLDRESTLLLLEEIDRLRALDEKPQMQLVADAANEAMEALNLIAADLRPVAAYGAGMISSILLRRSRELAQDKERQS